MRKFAPAFNLCPIHAVLVHGVHESPYEDVQDWSIESNLDRWTGSKIDPCIAAAKKTTG